MAWSWAVEAAVASNAASRSAKMWPGLVSMVSSLISCLGSFLASSLGSRLTESGCPIVRPRVRLFGGRCNRQFATCAQKYPPPWQHLTIVFTPALWLHGALFWDQKHAKQVPRRDAKPDHAAQG